MYRLNGPWRLVNLCSADNIRRVLAFDMWANIRARGTSRVDKSMYHSHRYMSSTYLDCIVCHRHKTLCPEYIGPGTVWSFAFHYISGNIRRAIEFAWPTGIAISDKPFSHMSIVDSSTSISSMDPRSASLHVHLVLFDHSMCILLKKKKTKLTKKNYQIGWNPWLGHSRPFTKICLLCARVGAYIVLLFVCLE